MFSIKICGVTTRSDGLVVARSAADAIGLNFYPKSKRFVSREVAREVCEAVDGQLLRVGVFVNETAEAILETVEQTGLDAVQLHGDEPVSILEQLKTIPVIRAFRCQEGDVSVVTEFLLRANDAGTPPAAVLLDAYHPGEYGGTGLTLDPRSLAGEVTELGGVHWVLAGGLTADNVGTAIELAGPAGVDTASGVESAPGVKDAEKVHAFAENARAAFNQ